jgi:GNAT superfamily N-acetyltransferase
MPIALEVRRLRQADRCADFASGSEPLDVVIRRYAKQNEARKTSATFVACVAETIAGFATIVPHSVEPAPLKAHVKNLSNFDAPVLLLARMATDARFQKQGVAAQVLRDAVFARAVELSDGFGCVGVYVHPKPDVVPFYARYGFVALLDDGMPPPMFLPLGVLRSAMQRV